MKVWYVATRWQSLLPGEFCFPLQEIKLTLGFRTCVLQQISPKQRTKGISPALSPADKQSDGKQKNQVSFAHAEIEIYNFHFAIVCAFSQIYKVPGSIICLALTSCASVHLSEMLRDYRHSLSKNSKEQKNVSCSEKLQEADHYFLATRVGRPPPLKWDANLCVMPNCNRYPEEFSSDMLESLPGICKVSLHCGDPCRSGTPPTSSPVDWGSLKPRGKEKVACRERVS